MWRCGGDGVEVMSVGVWACGGVEVMGVEV